MKDNGVRGQSPKQTSGEAAILPNAHALDPHLKKMKVLADRMFGIYSEQPEVAKGQGGEDAGTQKMLEVYS